MAERLYHCFGSLRAHTVDTDLAVAMLEASGCPYLTLNTHDIADVERPDDLRVGYASATFGSITRRWSGPPLTPVLNINLPTTAAEAIERARRAVDLTGFSRVKLEVLTPDQSLVDTAAVVVAAYQLLRIPNLEVWPLIAPDIETFRRLQDAGCMMIRVMGSPIGSRRGLLPEWSAAFEEILAAKEVPVMLDGGVGTVAHVLQALELGFDSVLVNSCLFGEGVDPVAQLRVFCVAIEVRPSPVPRGSRE